MADQDVTIADPHVRPAEGSTAQIARYELIESIGRGGMGEVIAARDKALGRDVAIKRMLSAPNDKAIRRFLREARVQARLDHPAVVPVHDLGRDKEGRPFFAMKKLAGTTLRVILERGGASRQQLLRAFADVCLAIELAHTRNIIHRDLKPENIMLGDFGEVYVLDWGVAKLVGDEHDDALGGDSNDDALTKTGLAVGTLGYMAPEQARGEPIDTRADIYALGCILFEIVTGARAFANGRPSLLRPDVPYELDELCARALASDRGQRVATARELATKVQSFLDGDRDLERRRTLAGEHAAAAQKALAEGDSPEHRSRAMREAGRALALDPTRRDVGEVIGALMLQPPAETPPELEHAVAEEKLSVMRSNALPTVFGTLTILAFTTLAFVFTAAPFPHILLLNCVGLMLVVMQLLARTVRHVQPIAPVLLVAGMAVVVAIFARLYSPLVVAPVIAATSAMVFMFNPQYRRVGFPIYVGVIMLAAVLGPFVAELTGVIAPTITFTDQGAVIHTPALQATRSVQIAMAVIYVVSAIGSCTALGYALRRSEHTVRRQMHVQAWHLRQLLSPAPVTSRIRG